MQEKLILLRERNGYSIKYVADYLGISPKQYRAKEKGEYAFDSDEMWALSYLFGKGLEDIFSPRGNQIGDKINVS